MEIKTYAPVVIPTLCRYDTFSRCVNSLSKCTGADQTELFIGIDYPAKEEHWEGYCKICSCADQLQGFKAVHIYKRETNYGQKKNTKSLLEEIKSRFDRYILSEDDNEFAPNFLEYVNKGLEKYKNDSKVIAICGFNFPFDYLEKIKGYDKNAFPMQYFSAWGIGRWVDKGPKNYVSNKEKAREIVFSWSAVLKLWKAGHYSTVKRLINRYQGAFADIMYRIYCVFEDKYCIFPAVSKVRNLGNEGNGTVCVIVDHRYANQKIDTESTFDYDDFEIKTYKPVQKACRKLASYNKKNIYMIPLCIIEYVWFRITKKTFDLKPIVKKYRHIMKRD